MTLPRYYDYGVCLRGAMAGMCDLGTREDFPMHCCNAGADLDACQDRTQGRTAVKRLQ